MARPLPPDKRYEVNKAPVGRGPPLIPNEKVTPGFTVGGAKPLAPEMPGIPLCGFMAVDREPFKDVWKDIHAARRSADPSALCSWEGCVSLSI